MLLLDMFERILLSLIFVFMAASFLRAWRQGASYSSAIVLMSEAIVVVFVICRRLAAKMSLRPADCVLAFIGTAAPLLVRTFAAQVRYR